MAGSLAGNPYAVRQPLRKLQLLSYGTRFLIRKIAGNMCGSSSDGGCIEEDWSGTLRERADLQAGDHVRLYIVVGGWAVMLRCFLCGDQDVFSGPMDVCSCNRRICVKVF